MKTDLDTYVVLRDEPIRISNQEPSTLPKRKRRIFVDGSTSCIPTVEQEASTSAVIMTPRQIQHTRSVLSDLCATYANELDGLNVFPHKTRVSRWTLIMREAGKRNVKIDVELKVDSMEITANSLVMETGQNSVGISSLGVLDFFALPLWKLEEWFQLIDPSWCWDADQHDAIVNGRIQLRGLSIATYTKRFPVVDMGDEPAWHLSQSFMALFYSLMHYAHASVVGEIRRNAAGNSYRKHLNDAFKNLHVTAKHYTDKDDGITGLRIRQTNAQGIVLFTLSPYDKLAEMASRGESVSAEMRKLLAERIRLDLKVEAAFLDLHELRCPADLAKADKLENLLWDIMNEAVSRLGLLYAFEVHGRVVKGVNDYQWDLDYYSTESARINKTRKSDMQHFERWLNYEVVHVKEAARNRIRAATGFDVRFSRDAHVGFTRVINESLIPENARTLIYESIFAKTYGQLDQSSHLYEQAKVAIKDKSPIIASTRAMLRGMNFFR